MKQLPKTGVGWLRIASAAGYMDVSPRTIRRLLREGLPHVRIRGTGTILINMGQLDCWLLQEQQEAKVGEDDLVTEIVTSWSGTPDDRVRRPVIHAR